MKNGIFSCLMLAVVMVTGCSQASGDDGYTGGDLRALNHTLQGINGYSVNGYGGSMTGNSCCIMLPKKWTPDLKARVEWETDPDPYAKLPPLGTDKYRNAYAQHKKNYRQHSTTVDIPKYGEDRCGLTVHFLPCDQIKITTVCAGYGTPDYPIKEPRKMKEPASCPVK